MNNQLNDIIPSDKKIARAHSKITLNFNKKTPMFHIYLCVPQSNILVKCEANNFNLLKEKNCLQNCP